MSAKSKARASGYSVATRRCTAESTYDFTPSVRIGTVTLILTPKLIQRFGGIVRKEPRLVSALLSVSELYQKAMEESLLPVMKSKSVPDFEIRARKGLLTYSRQYDEILHWYISILGESRFKLEYVKQITEIDKELRALPFASLDLVRLFHRHMACCTNAATHYDELFESDTNKLYRIDLLLRTSNYGLTLLVLLINRKLTGPLWVMMELQQLTSDALEEMESMPEIHATEKRLSGSLVFAEGEIDFTPESRKPQLIVLSNTR